MTQLAQTSRTLLTVDLIDQQTKIGEIKVESEWFPAVIKN